MDKKIEVKSGGIGFTGLLTIVLVIAKLTGHFAHSWWWVFAPIWLPIVVILVGIALVAAVAGIALGIKKLME